MLTATYAFSVISAEHQRARHVLSRMEQCLHSPSWKALLASTPASLKVAFEQMAQFHEGFHLRKMETQIVPALQETEADIDSLLDEIAILGAKAKSVFKSLRLQFMPQPHRKSFSLSTDEILVLMLAYCRYQLSKLAKEEQHLLPLAWRTLSPDKWFGIATNCLSENRKPDYRAKPDNGRAGSCVGIGRFAPSFRSGERSSVAISYGGL